MGATHEDEAGFDYRVTAAGVNDVLTKALNFAPGLADATVENIHVGYSAVYSRIASGNWDDTGL